MLLRTTCVALLYSKYLLRTICRDIFHIGAINFQRWMTRDLTVDLRSPVCHPVSLNTAVIGPQRPYA